MSTTLDRLRFGDRFSVRSRSGSTYELTFLHRGQAESGLFVRLPDGRISRLTPGRLDLETLQVRGSDHEALRPGDAVLVTTGSGRVRGTYRGRGQGDQLVVELPLGVSIEYPLEDVQDACFLFKARDLKRGDQLFVTSKSEHEYCGTVRALGPGDRVKIRPGSGGSVSIHLSQVDLSSLAVLVPISLAS